MSETIADETDKYARNGIAHITNDRDPIEQMDDPSNKKYNRQQMERCQCFGYKIIHDTCHSYVPHSDMCCALLLVKSYITTDSFLWKIFIMESSK